METAGKIAALGVGKAPGRATPGNVRSMRETRIIMGMPVSVAVPDDRVRGEDLAAVFAEFTAADDQFGMLKNDSEISRINRGEIIEKEVTPRMREILALCEKTRRDTGGYFDILRADGTFDLCGVVKAWAIRNASHRLAGIGFANFCIAAGGDIQCHGLNDEGRDWTVGIRNPALPHEMTVLRPMDHGVATCVNYIRGNHVFDRHTGLYGWDNIVSLTVIGRDVLQADCYAAAAFAMGRGGVDFIDRTMGLEGYEIDAHGAVRMTSGLTHFLSC